VSVQCPLVRIGTPTPLPQASVSPPQLECGVFVPSSELGLPHPLSCKRVCPPPTPLNQSGGCNTGLQVMGWGVANSDDWRESQALYLLYDLCQTSDCHLTNLSPPPPPHILPPPVFCNFDLVTCVLHPPRCLYLVFPHVFVHRCLHHRRLQLEK
jgi:hypothetical protein